jgi:hypothetical protein
MFKVQVRVTLLTLLFPLFLNATTHVLTNEILKPKAIERIEQIAQELHNKVGVYGYVIATNDAIPRGTSMHMYIKKYEKQLGKPYVIYLFAPQNKRVGIIPSSEELKSLYNSEDVKDAGIDVIAVKDKNSLEDKYNIGVVQAFSVLAEQIAIAKGKTLTTAIPNETSTIITILKVIVYIGALFVVWIFMVRPLLERKKET